MRNNPESMIRYVKQYGASPLCQNPQACRVVEAKLKSLNELQAVQLEQAAANACFVNLTKNENEESSMISGGAVTEYERQTNRAKPDYEAVDSFKKKWAGSALDILIEFLVSFYSA